MFRKDKSSASNQNITTIIGHEAVVSGPIKTTATIRVDGKVNNDILADVSVIIGEKGEIKGNVQAQEILVYGKLNGNVTGNSVIIKDGSHVVGNIIAQKLAIEPGSTFVGDVQMDFKSNKDSKELQNQGKK